MYDVNWRWNCLTMSENLSIRMHFSSRLDQLTRNSNHLMKKKKGGCRWWNPPGSIRNPSKKENNRKGSRIPESQWENQLHSNSLLHSIYYARSSPCGSNEDGPRQLLPMGRSTHRGDLQRYCIKDPPGLNLDPPKKMCMEHLL